LTGCCQGGDHVKGSLLNATCGSAIHALYKENDIKNDLPKRRRKTLLSGMNHAKLCAFEAILAG
jgi:hypothetical protein